MVGRRGLSRLAWVSLAAAVLAALWQWQQLRLAVAFNQAVDTGDYVLAARHPSPRGAFARAPGAGRQQGFDALVSAYAALSVDRDRTIASAAAVNLANAYLRRAIQLNDEGARDLAIPLLELAKHSYRELLRQGHGEWDIRYNLELALVLLPDLPAREADEEVNPEHSSRAISTMPVEEALP